MVSFAGTDSTDLQVPIPLILFSWNMEATKELLENFNVSRHI